MMNATYRPRRASSRWLDGDCPRGVLAIFDDSRFTDRYTIFYADAHTDPHGSPWISYLGTSESLGFSGHGEMPAHEVRDYRYHNSHRACRWSELPEVIRNFVRNDVDA